MQRIQLGVLLTRDTDNWLILEARKGQCILGSTAIIYVVEILHAVEIKLPLYLTKLTLTTLLIIRIRVGRVYSKEVESG